MDEKDGREACAEMWLDAEQQAAWRAVVQLLTKLPAALESDLQRTAGLTRYEYEVLSLLSESGALTLQMSELAAGTHASLSRLSHVVARLERRGWVTRQACPTDGRAFHAVLTESGLAKVVEAAPHHVRAVRGLVVDALSPAQLRQLAAAAARIGRRVDERTTTRAPEGTRR